VALAYPIDDITIDGNLDDWPDDMRRYPIARVEYGDPIKGTGDFEAWFRIGYNASQNALYVAVEVRDESAVKSWSWQDTDGCNMYIDSSHAQEDSAADQFITYGYNRTARVSKQAVAWEWKHLDGLHRYEWRLNVDKIGGSAIRLRSGMTIGWDIAICDKDSDESFSWVAWGRGADKRSSPEKCGDVVLMAPGQSTGWLEGQVSWRNTSPEVAGENVLIRSPMSDDLWVRTRTNREGIYRVELPEGRYQIKAGQERRTSATVAVEIRDGEQTQADLDVLGPIGLTVKAGPGRSVKAVGSWLENRFHLITPLGLTDVRVRAMVQTPDSHLWLATNQGLARYDGEAFTFFTSKDGLLVNSLSALTVDHLGQLWIGTLGGLCVYRGETFTHFTTEDGLIDNEIRSLLEDRAGRLWIGTSRGARVYDGKDFTHFTTEHGLRHNEILTLMEDRLGRMWLGTAYGGVSVYDGETFASLGAKEGLASDRVRALLEDRSGRIWIGTRDSGVSLYDGTEFTNYTAKDGLADNVVSSLLEDDSGRVWIGGTWKGLSVFHDGKFSVYASESGSGGVRTFLEDREGNLWWGTDSGLIRYDKALTFPVELKTLQSHAIRTLLEDSAGRIWIGTDSGASVYDGNAVTDFTGEHGLARGPVLGLLEDSAGRIWMSTTGSGVSVYDGNSCTSFDFQSGLLNNQPRSLMEDSTGQVWIITYTGVSVYDGMQFSHFTIEDGLVDNNVQTLLKDRTGRVWMGTAFGISVYDGTRFTSITKTDGLVDNDVTCLLEDRSGRIWIGTRDGGISVYDGIHFSSLAKEDGLVSDMVRSLLEDQAGHIWIGTAGGNVSRYDGKSFQSLTYEDGLPGGSVDALMEDTHGHMWIGTAVGMVRYQSGHTHPLVSLVDVVTDRRRGPIDRIRLPSTQPLLAFGYRALSLKTRPGGMVYRYRLKGYDTRWQTTHHRRVEYHDLPRGNYTFELQAVDRDLSYSEVPVQVAVAVHLPYGLITLWLSVTVAVVMGVWQIVQLCQRGLRLRAARDELELRVKERTSELSQANAMLTEEITEHKEAEESLCRSEQRYRNFLTHNVAGVWRYEFREPMPLSLPVDDQIEWMMDKGVLVEHNDALARMYGLPSGSDATGTTHRELHAHDENEAAKQLRAWIKGGYRFDGGEFFCCIYTGQYRWFMVMGHGVIENDHLISSWGTQVDITERKKAQAALAESEQRFRKFFENEPEYCYMVSPQDIILEANSAALSTLGYERQELVGRPLKAIYAPECHEKMHQLLATWEEAGEVRDEEMTLITRNGDRRAVLLHASQVLDENGTALYSVSVQRDITEQRRLEAQEQAYQRQLAHVSRLTVAGELASGIAHELNQPLGAIATFSDGCKRLIDSGEADSSEVRDALAQISAQAQRGGDIIRRMRHFVSKREHEFSITDLNSIVRESLRLVQANEARRGVSLSLDLAEGSLAVFVDRIQIQQVIINLMQNGLESMDETASSECRLTVKTVRLGHDKVRVAVVDRGAGISDNDTEKAFEPFYTTKAEGLGIGLSISRSIIEVHQGRIWGVNNPDRGMTFGFELPSKST